MATPMTPAQLKKQFEKWGVNADYRPGWDSTRSGRDDETGLVFGPVYGGVVHHTGDDAPDSLDRNVIQNGRSDLPGPLAHFGIWDSGLVDVFTTRRANHAGGGDGRVLAAVRSEDYGKYPPRTTKHQGSSGATDGNDCFYGTENYYSGARQMTAAQYESQILVYAAICDFYGWSAKSIIGHKEWSDWKPDPGSHDMASIRADIDARLKAGPPGSEKPVVTNVAKAVELLAQAEKLLRTAADVRGRPYLDDVADKVRAQRARLPRPKK